jgi:hypothetical protein
MPQDWRDTRFDTGAKFGSDRAQERNSYYGGTTNNWNFGRPGGDLELPPWPDIEGNPDPGGQPGDMFYDLLNDILKMINRDGEVVDVTIDGGWPDWFVLTDVGLGVHTVEILAASELGIYLENLPTSDPGGGFVWLSVS